MSIQKNKISVFEKSRIQIKNIAHKIIQGNSVFEIFKGKEYRIHADKGTVFVKIMKNDIMVSSVMSYEAVKGNSFNIALNLAKNVKIAMKLLF